MNDVRVYVPACLCVCDWDSSIIMYQAFFNTPAVIDNVTDAIPSTWNVPSLFPGHISTTLQIAVWAPLPHEPTGHLFLVNWISIVYCGSVRVCVCVCPSDSSSLLKLWLTYAVQVN